MVTMSVPRAPQQSADSVIADIRQALANFRPRVQAISDPDLSTLAARARALYFARRQRAKFLPQVADLFHEPVWDMLLDLFVAGERGDFISVTSACIGAAVPATTGLRTLSVLEDRKLVVIEADAFDKRRRFVKLSDDAHQSMVEYLTSD